MSVDYSLFTPPVSLGARAVAWPSNEVESLVSAYIAGKSESEIKLLVKVLLEKRIQEVA
jgi:prophage regulatory protein